MYLCTNELKHKPTNKYKKNNSNCKIFIPVNLTRISAWQNHKTYKCLHNVSIRPELARGYASTLIINFGYLSVLFFQQIYCTNSCIVGSYHLIISLFTLKVQSQLSHNTLTPYNFISFQSPQTESLLCLVTTPADSNIEYGLPSVTNNIIHYQ